MEGRVGGASSHAFIIHPPNPRVAESYQSVAGGSVATRGTSPSRAHEDAAVGDAAKGSAKRHLNRFRRFLRPLEPRGWIERGCACERVNVHMCEARAPERCFRAYGLRSAFRENSKPLCVMVLVNRLYSCLMTLYSLKGSITSLWSA